MDKLADSLKENHQVMSLTILDHGESDPHKDGMTLPELSEVMRGCYKQLDFEPNVLIGHSVGGMIGMVLTAEHPEEFTGLILVDIAPFESSGRSSRPTPPEYLNSRKDAREWVVERYPTFTEYYIENRVKNVFKVKDGKYYLKPKGDNIWDGLVTDLWSFLERVKCPVMLLKGVNSDLVKPETKARMAKMPNVEIIEVEGTGHMIPQDVPDEFESLVRGFLKRI